MLLVNRFGVIAASQLPIHAFLTAAHLHHSGVGFSWRTRASLKRLHKISGRIIVSLLSLHAFLYCQFFLKVQRFGRVIRQPNIIVALASVGILLVLAVTSLSWFRRSHPKIFRTLHSSGSVTVLALLFFHVSRVRVFLLETALVLVLNTALRRLR